jgi:hypothetical protein
MSVTRSVFASRIGTDPRRNRAGDKAQPFDAFAQRAELVVINDAGKLVDPRLERMPAIVIEKELRVGKPGAQHALVTVDDRR